MGAHESDAGGLTRFIQGKEAVVEASAAARAFGETHSLTVDACARLSIIVEELIANLFDHGGLADTDEVELSLASEPGGIRIVIVDPGPPFDPRAPAPRDRPEGGGGAGIDIVRAWAEVVDYALIPEGNRLELLLPVALKWE